MLKLSEKDLWNIFLKLCKRAHKWYVKNGKLNPKESVSDSDRSYWREVIQVIKELSRSTRRGPKDDVNYWRSVSNMMKECVACWRQVSSLIKEFGGKVQTFNASSITTTNTQPTEEDMKYWRQAIAMTIDLFSKSSATHQEYWRSIAQIIKEFGRKNLKHKGWVLKMAKQVVPKKNAQFISEVN